MNRSRSGNHDRDMVSPRGIGRRRLIIFASFTVLFGVAATFLGGELLVRLLVAEETFWPVSNIYRPLDDPDLRYTYRPHLSAIVFGVPLETNALGLRGPDWAPVKLESTRRIALIGDSYAFGFGVPFEDTVGEQLARLLELETGRGHEVLNFGVNGYNSRQQLAMLEKLALRFEPDLVILLPTNNDHDDPLAADEQGWLHFDGQVHNPQSRMRDARDLGDVSGLMGRSRLALYLSLRYRFLRREWRDRGLALLHSDDDEWMGEVPDPFIAGYLRDTVYRPLKQMVSTLDARGVPAIVASACASMDYRETLRALAEETAVPMLELLTLFPEADTWHEWAAKFGLGWDDHPNAEAHLRFARALAERIVELDASTEKHRAIPEG